MEDIHTGASKRQQKQFAEISRHQLPTNGASNSKNFYSSFSVLGRDNFEMYKRNQIMTNFHARVLNAMDPRIRVHEHLEQLFSYKKGSSHMGEGLMPPPMIPPYELTSKAKPIIFRTVQADEIESKMAEDYIPQPNVPQDHHLQIIQLFEEDRGYKGLPPQEGGVDYREQFELIKISNLVLLDQITLIQQNQQVKDSLEKSDHGNALQMEGAYKKHPVYNPGQGYSTSNLPFLVSKEGAHTTQPGPQQYFTTQRDPYAHKSPEDQHLLTRDQLRRFNIQNPQQQGGVQQPSDAAKGGFDSQSVSQAHRNKGVIRARQDDEVSRSQSSCSQDFGQRYSGGLAYDKNNKRYRRTANEIERRFQCWCGKAYGSEGSLNQHKKLKNHMGDPHHR